MHKFKSIIIDDERLARLELRELLAAHQQIEVIAEAANAAEAIPLIDQYQPDLLFLDIQMPKWSGFDLLEQLTHAPKVIFTTAYDQYALKAFEVNALDYLLKPISQERLAACLSRLVTERMNPKLSHSNELNGKQIFIKDGDRCFFLQLNDIQLFRAYDNYARVYFNEETAMVKKSLNQLEEKLSTAHFFRCNRSEIVNLRRIDNVRTLTKGKLTLLLQNGESIAISERKSVLFRELMSL